MAASGPLGAFGTVWLIVSIAWCGCGPSRAEGIDDSPARTERAKLRMRVHASSPWSVTAVEFLDASGTVTRHIEASSASREVGDALHFEVVHIAAGSEAAVVTREHVIARPASDSRATTISNTVTLFDAGGTVLFEKRDLDCVCFQVSDTGDTVVCMAEEHEYDEQSADLQGAPREEEAIVVLDRDGSERRRIVHESGLVDGRDLRLSPNGRWLAYQAREALDWSTPKIVLLHDLARRTVLRVAEARGVGAVSNEGDLLRARFEGAPRPRFDAPPGENRWEVVWRRPR